jgi:hypothetical protein
MIGKTGALSIRKFMLPQRMKVWNYVNILLGYTVRQKVLKSER